MTRDGAPEIAIVPAWPAPARVRAYSTLRIGGVSAGRYSSLNRGTHVGDDPVKVSENRRRAAERLKLPSEPRWLEQVHGRDVLDLDRTVRAVDLPETERAVDLLPAERAPEARAPDLQRPHEASGRASADNALGPADGAVTARAGVVCVILTADCIPVLLADRRGRRVGAAHAGWRGLAQGVLPATVAALGVPPEDVLAWLGPAIGPRAFEVGDEVRAAFADQGFTVLGAFERNTRGRWQANLYALATESLNRAGVRAVYGGDRCTFTEADRFFSHRREAPCGRMASLIWLD